MMYFVLHAFCLAKFALTVNATGASCGVLNRHFESHTQQQCVEQVTSFKAVMEKKADFIKSQLSEAYQKQTQVNTTALFAIVDTVQFLIKQGFGLRVSNCNKSAKREDEHSSSLLDFLSSYSS